MKRAIKGSPHKSRTEAFLEWVEAHPSEIVFVEPSDEDFERSFASRRVGETSTTETIRWEPGGSAREWHGTDSNGHTFLLRQSINGGWTIYVDGRRRSFSKIQFLPEAKHEAERYTGSPQTISVRPFSGSGYERNSNRCGPDDTPCAWCGKPVVDRNIDPNDRMPMWKFMVRVVDGGARFGTEDEFFDRVPVDAAGDMGFFPVGAACAKKLQADGVFVGKEERSVVGEMRESDSLPTEQQIIDYFLFDAEDTDVGLFSRAGTDEVADHFRLEPAVAFRLLDKLAKKKLLEKSRDLISRTGKKVVGYQQWEYHWRPGDLGRYDEHNGLKQ